MKIIKIFPWGWCEGVFFAYSRIKKIIALHPDLNIYMVGWLVHNRSVIEELEKLGVITIGSNKKNKLSLIKKIKNKNNSVIVFSAHGTDPEIIKYARQNFYKVYDLTCKYVEENIEKVRRELSNKKNVLFFGIKDHPESDAFRSLSPKVKVVNSLNDLNKMKRLKNSEIYGTTQSTISIKDSELFRNYFVNNFKNPKFVSGSCMATKMRQENLEKNLNKIELLVVVGDKKSNNTKNLVNIAIKSGVPVKWVSSWREIVLGEFKKIKKCGICSGASTPLEKVEEVYELLTQINK